MEGLQIGQLLYEIRQKHHVKQKELCRGICGVSTYSLYENGGIIPDMLSTNLFLERLGYTVKGLSAYISEKEEKYLAWRNQTRECIREENYEKLKKIIYLDLQENVSFNKQIIRQYYLFLEGVLQEKREYNLEKAKYFYEEALKCSCEFILNKWDMKGYLGVEEIHIYVIYLNLLTKMYPQEKRNIIVKLYSLLEYLDEHCIEDLEKVKIYPLVACVWGNMVSQKDNPEKKYMVFEKALTLLKRQKSVYCLTEILSLLICAGKEMHRDMSEEIRDRNVFVKFCEEFEYNCRFNMYVSQIEEIMTENIGNYLSLSRKNINYTQEEVSENICSVESYSRIENGRKPNKKNYIALASKLGIENRYYMDLLNTNKIEIIILRREISYYISTEKREELEQTLNKLKSLLNKEEISQNRQYLEYIETRVAYRKKCVSEIECYDKYIKILGYTFSVKEIGEGKHIYTILEINIINSISVCMDRMGKTKEAMKLIEKFLGDIERQGNGKYYQTNLAKLNFARWNADMGQIELAEKIYIYGIKETLKRNRAFLLDEYVGELAFTKNIVTGRDTKDVIRRYYLYALVISKFFGTERVYKITLQYCKKYCDEKDSNVAIFT